jgi:hypothetical protein
LECRRTCRRSTSSANYSSLYQTQYSGAEDSAYAKRGQGGFRASTPAKIGVGLAGNLPSARFELDAGFHFPRSRATEAELTVDELVAVSGRPAIERSAELSYFGNARPVLNTGVGLEWFFRPKLGLLMGMSTDFSSTPPLNEEPTIGTVTFARANRAAGSIGLGSYGQGTELVVGLEVSPHVGKVLRFEPLSAPEPPRSGRAVRLGLRPRGGRRHQPERAQSDGRERREHREEGPEMSRRSSVLGVLGLALAATFVACGRAPEVHRPQPSAKVDATTVELVESFPLETALGHPDVPDAKGTCG